MYVTLFNPNARFDVSTSGPVPGCAGVANRRSRMEPWRTFIRQWASAWSWIGLARPGVQTRRRRLKIPGTSQTRLRVYCFEGLACAYFDQ
jgi:hypothetical protein